MIDIDALADELTSAANIVTCDGYYEIDTDAVAQCLSRHLATAQTEAAELRAENERLREALRSTQWTVANQTVTKALCEAVACCALGPSDDDGTLTLYDIIPDVWCVPDRFAATNDIAEQIAFTALEAWLTAARTALRARGGEHG